MTCSRRYSKVDLKVVMIGDSSIGKTCLVLRYTDRQFQEAIGTIAAANILKTWGNYKIAIWETGDKDRFTGKSPYYYRNTAAVILAFDLTDRQTFESLGEKYVPILESVCFAKLYIIAGTKKDLLYRYKRAITVEEGKKLARQLNPQIDPDTGFIPYFETSSKNGADVDNMFEYIFEHFYPNGGSEPHPLDTCPPVSTGNIMLTNKRRSIMTFCSCC